MPIAAEWTPDCQGKQDFDGPIVVISTRLWPQGGGFDVLDGATGKWKSNDDRPEVYPSAHASIVICDRDDSDETVCESEFSADTEEEVKRQVEEWANTQRDRIILALRNEFLKGER